MGVDAETIEAGTKAVETAARPSVFPALVALVALAGVGLLVWRDEVRADAQIQVLQRMADELGQVKQTLEERLPRPGQPSGAQLAAPATLRSR